MTNQKKQMGEGSYEGSEAYRQRSKEFLDSHDEAEMQRMAKAAEDAIEGTERAELEAAERAGRRHARE